MLRAHSRVKLATINPKEILLKPDYLLRYINDYKLTFVIVDLRIPPLDELFADIETCANTTAILRRRLD